MAFRRFVATLGRVIVPWRFLPWFGAEQPCRPSRVILLVVCAVCLAHVLSVLVPTVRFAGFVANWAIYFVPGSPLDREICGGFLGRMLWPYSAFSSRYGYAWKSPTAIFVLMNIWSVLTGLTLLGFRFVCREARLPAVRVVRMIAYGCCGLLVWVCINDIAALMPAVGALIDGLINISIYDPGRGLCLEEIMIFPMAAIVAFFAVWFAAYPFVFWWSALRWHFRTRHPFALAGSCCFVAGCLTLGLMCFVWGYLP